MIYISISIKNCLWGIMWLNSLAIFLDAQNLLKTNIADFMKEKLVRGI